MLHGVTPSWAGFCGVGMLQSGPALPAAPGALRCPGTLGADAAAKGQGRFSTRGLEEVRCQPEKSPHAPLGLPLGANRLSRLGESGSESSWGPRAPAPVHLPALNKSGLTSPAVCFALLPVWAPAVGRECHPAREPRSCQPQPSLLSLPAPGRAGAPDGQSKPERLGPSLQTLRAAGPPPPPPPHPAPPHALESSAGERTLCL